jgi:HTH-type transcriptional regulator, competence development regulator
VNSKTFGKLIRKARREKEYSQRELAKLVGVNFTYLSKLENDHADYPPSKEVIQSLAKHLNLDEIELTQLAGRINPEDTEIFQDLFKQYQKMPVLLRRLRDNPAFAEKVFLEADKDQAKEKEN